MERKGKKENTKKRESSETGNIAMRFFITRSVPPLLAGSWCKVLAFSLVRIVQNLQAGIATNLCG